MANYPSKLALLGLLAAVGYANRKKIGNFATQARNRIENSGTAPNPVSVSDKPKGAARGKEEPVSASR